MNSPEVLAQLPDRIAIAKLSASANDFILLDNRERVFSESVSFLARALCARRYSVGADGLILIEASDVATVRIRFFNPDGNEFNTCGNGGRCAARFTHLFLSHQPLITMQTNIGVVDAHVIASAVKLKFIGPTAVKLNVVADTNSGESYSGHYVQIGEPHFITLQQNIRGIDFVSIARKLRYSSSFGSDGANVHFVEPLAGNYVKIRTYERGVEDETLACGSGCVSSAIALFENGSVEPPVTFEPQSGIPVIVHFQPGNHYNDLFLEGDARLIYRGEITKEALTGFPIRT